MLPFDQFRAAAERIPSAGQIREPFGLLLYALVGFMRPTVAIEVGTYHGYSAAWIARALEDNSRGHLLCIDDWSLAGASQEQTAGNLDQAGVRERVTFQAGQSLSQPWPRAEFVFLDGNHSFEVVVLEANKAASGGARMIVLHDTTSWWGPASFLDRERSNTRPDSVWDLLELPAAEGLTILMRRGEKPAPGFTQDKYPKGYIE